MKLSWRMLCIALFTLLVSCKTKIIETKYENGRVTKRHYQDGNFLTLNQEKSLLNHNEWNLRMLDNIKFYFDLGISEKHKELITWRVAENIGSQLSDFNSDKPLIFWVFIDQKKKELLTKNGEKVHLIKEYNSIYTYYTPDLVEQEFHIINKLNN